MLHGEVSALPIASHIHHRSASVGPACARTRETRERTASPRRPEVSRARAQSKCGFVFHQRHHVTELMGGDPGGVDAVRALLG